jgi:hypothetical protein
MYDRGIFYSAFLAEATSVAGQEVTALKESSLQLIAFPQRREFITIVFPSDLSFEVPITRGGVPYTRAVLVGV